MEYPVYVLDSSVEIPIPGASTHIIIPLDRAQYFNTNLVHITGITDPIQRIVLAIAKEDRDPTQLMHNPKALLEGTYEIGVIATVTDIEESENLLLASVKIEGRAAINMEPLLADWDKHPQVWIRTQFYPESFSSDEIAIPSDIEGLSKVIAKNKDRFRSELVRSLENEKSMVRRMDLMAHFLLREREKRLAYLQENSNLNRWVIVTSHISESLALKLKTPKNKISKAIASLSFRDKLEITPIPDNLKARVSEEIEKQENLPTNSTEASMLKDYLTWIFQLPWGKTSRRELDLLDLRKELDISHYGLPDVKDYLIEHLCIEQLKGSSNGAVICLVGPPGTGKSSIAKSLAISSGRQFQNIALGGLSDEAEIRGHRRTYIASRPGRIINALKNAGTMDPVILLDEIDKIDNTKGSPSAALLELLDPEQNHAFVDRYLELEMNMSKVLFICTANSEENIPSALIDRMELIHFREYTEEERAVILKNYILPKINKDYNIETLSITWDSYVLDQLAKVKQVRQIEKKARRLLRMAATRIHVHKQSEQLIDLDFSKPIISDIRTEKSPIGFGQLRS